MTEIRRDGWGRYLILPPGESRPRGYTRATTVTKALDDGGGLIPWKATATVVGALRRPGLMARWQAALAQHADPWYGSLDSKNACKKLVEECAEAGGSTDRADIGTALHAIVEQSLLGTAGTPILQPGMQADIDAFARTTSTLTFDRSLLEAVLVLDEYRVAGMSDSGRTTIPGIGDVISDLKTGTDLKYSWQTIAMQLAIYAHADAVYVQGTAADGSGDQRLPMPAVSQEVGLIIHLPAGEARCELHLVDLVAGWEAFQHAMWVRGWRGRKDLVSVFVLPGAQPVAPPSEPAFDEPMTAPAALPIEPPFDTPTPAEQHATMTTNPDEGGPADAAAFTALEQHYLALPAGPRSWITKLARDATQHGVSFHAKDCKTVRRFEILRALVQMAENGADDDETLRAVLASIDGVNAHSADVTPGHVVGSLTAGQAKIFARRTDELITTTVPVSVSDNGVLVLHFSDVGAAA